MLQEIAGRLREYFCPLFIIFLSLFIMPKTRGIAVQAKRPIPENDALYGEKLTRCWLIEYFLTRIFIEEDMREISSAKSFATIATSNPLMKIVPMRNRILAISPCVF